MKVADKASITITEENERIPVGTALLLDVEEFQPYEPSAYCWTPGWSCAIVRHGDTHWFFIDEAGEVWYEGKNIEVGLFESFKIGICPAQEKEYEKMLNDYAERYGEDG